MVSAGPSAVQRGVVGLAVSAMAVAGCGGGGGGRSAASQDLHVVATTSILGDVVGNVVGGAGRVDTLMEAGIDPHSYRPSAEAARLLGTADLVVANGLQLEETLLDALAAAEQEGAEVLRVADQLDPIPVGATLGDDHADDHADDQGGDRAADQGGDPHGHPPLDPHVWLDPLRMAEAVTLVAEHVARVAPHAAGRVRANAAAYRRQVLSLHEEVQAVLGEIPGGRRLLVTNHDAFGYLAARYELRVVGTVVPGGTTLAETSPRELARLAATIRATGAPAIFTENVAPDRLARTLSGEVGRKVRVVPLYSDALGETGSGADTYLGMLRTDARLIADALGT
ncbi:MAG TPA: metal ABC transporter substrate-binding protein [Nitriliruptorales bacterium]|nr:metal ABC transporter substrate-binding protein [Nitriliruptorales bacterium]